MAVPVAWGDSPWLATPSVRVFVLQQDRVEPLRKVWVFNGGKAARFWKRRAEVQTQLGACQVPPNTPRQIANQHNPPTWAKRWRKKGRAPSIATNERQPNPLEVRISRDTRAALQCN